MMLANVMRIRQVPAVAVYDGSVTLHQHEGKLLHCLVALRVCFP